MINDAKTSTQNNPRYPGGREIMDELYPANSKPVIRIPSYTRSNKYKTSTFESHLNKPSVSKLIGKSRSLMMGLRIKLKMTKTNEATR